MYYLCSVPSLRGVASIVNFLLMSRGACFYFAQYGKKFVHSWTRLQIACHWADQFCKKRDSRFLISPCVDHRTRERSPKWSYIDLYQERITKIIYIHLLHVSITWWYTACNRKKLRFGIQYITSTLLTFDNCKELNFNSHFYTTYFLGMFSLLEPNLLNYSLRLSIILTCINFQSSTIWEIDEKLNILFRK